MNFRDARALTKREKETGQYRADDREEAGNDWALTAPDAAGRHADIIGGHPDLAAILILWADRDVLYAQRKTSLTEQAIESIREYRQREAGELPLKQRARAWALANAWYPPEHGQ